jgi:hypothetical protein
MRRQEAKLTGTLEYEVGNIPASVEHLANPSGRAV